MSDSEDKALDLLRRFFGAVCETYPAEYGDSQCPCCEYNGFEFRSHSEDCEYAEAARFLGESYASTTSPVSPGDG